MTTDGKRGFWTLFTWWRTRSYTFLLLLLLHVLSFIKLLSVNFSFSLMIQTLYHRITLFSVGCPRRNYQYVHLTCWNGSLSKSSQVRDPPWVRWGRGKDCSIGDTVRGERKTLRHASRRFDHRSKNRVTESTYRRRTSECHPWRRNRLLW